MSDIWNRCDVCGKWISYADFFTGAASRRMVTPDSESSREEFETLCEAHRDWPKVTNAA